MPEKDKKTASPATSIPRADPKPASNQIPCLSVATPNGNAAGARAPQVQGVRDASASVATAQVERYAPIIGQPEIDEIRYIAPLVAR